MFGRFCGGGGFGIPFQTHFWNNILMFVILVAILTAGIILIARAVQRFNHKHIGSGNGEFSKPFELAKERYARGEITREEYRSILSDLEPGQNG